MSHLFFRVKIKMSRFRSPVKLGLHEEPIYWMSKFGAEVKLSLEVKLRHGIHFNNPSVSIDGSMVKQGWIWSHVNSLECPCYGSQFKLLAQELIIMSLDFPELRHFSNKQPALNVCMRSRSRLRSL